MPPGGGSIGQRRGDEGVSFAAILEMHYLHPEFWKICAIVTRALDNLVMLHSMLLLFLLLLEHLDDSCADSSSFWCGCFLSVARGFVLFWQVRDYSMIAQLTKESGGPKPWLLGGFFGLRKDH